jgi:hypothetical protein
MHNWVVDKYPITKVCPYCGSEVVLTSNAEIYHGKEFGNGKCYLCRNCGASVGVHNDLVTPLGILATPEMKRLKMVAHNLFDMCWKSKQISRNDCYKKLADKMGMPVSECHFGWFGEEELKKAISIIRIIGWYKR